MVIGVVIGSCVGWMESLANVAWAWATTLDPPDAVVADEPPPPAVVAEDDDVLEDPQPTRTMAAQAKRATNALRPVRRRRRGGLEDGLGLASCM